MFHANAHCIIIDYYKIFINILFDKNKFKRHGYAGATVTFGRTWRRSKEGVREGVGYIDALAFKSVFS